MERARVRGGKKEVGARVRQTNSEAKAQVPAEASVGYLTVRIETSPDAVLRAFAEHNEVLYGRYDERTATIMVDTNCHLDVLKETLVHELLHAIIKQTNSTMSDDDEESLVRSLSPLLYGVLKNNPQLVDYLMTS